jgi:AraC-like DNA-binding protein/effector-binding domain-containing protein
MERRLKQVHEAVAYVTAHLDEDPSLTVLASKARTSPFHLHRLFSTAMGETPKQLSLRLRLARASVLLLVGDDSVLDVALSCGFRSHEVFCRAFRRRFGMKPSEYRERGFASRLDSSQAKDHAAVVCNIGPCLGLYHFSEKGRSAATAMSYKVTTIELSPQPVLVVRRRVKRSEIAATIGSVLPHVFQHAQQHGMALTGLPFTRYIDVGPGLVTMEPGMRIAGAPNQIATPIESSWTEAAGSADVRMDTLPGGLAVRTMHAGPYDQLQEAYAAIQQWMETEGVASAGPPWEAYINDPSEYPDPKDWKTEVFWPVQR